MRAIFFGDIRRPTAQHILLQSFG